MIVIFFYAIVNPILSHSIQFELDLNINKQKSNRFDNIRQLIDQDLSSDLKSNIITANISIGKPKQNFNLAYDIGSHQTWVVQSQLNEFVQNTYDKTKSETVIHKGGNYFIEEYYGYEIKEQIQFSSNNLNPMMNKSKELFSLVVIYNLDNNKYLPYDGALGLNREYNEKEIFVGSSKRAHVNHRFSIIEYLYNNKYIERRVFSHKAISKTKGILYLGETGTKEKNYPTCNSVTPTSFEKSAYSSYWHCYTSAIYNQKTRSKIMDLALEAVFDSNFDYLAFPEEEGKLLFDYLQKNGLDGCKQKSVLDIGTTLLCKVMDRAKLPDISFYISGFNVTITPDDYIKENITQDDIENEITVYQLKIITDSYLRLSFLLGSFALLKQQMIFDYENDSVGFIALKQNPIDNKELRTINDINRLKYVMMCFIVMMSISIIITLLFCLLIYKKQVRFKQYKIVINNNINYIK